MLYELLTKEELEMIEYYRHNYVDDYKSDNYVPNEYILRIWEKQKRHLYQALGNKLIYKKEIEYRRPLNELADIFNNFASGKAVSFLKNTNVLDSARNFFLTLSGILAHYHKGSDFVDEFYAPDYVTKICGVYSVLKNRITEDIVIENIKFQKGMKTIKAMEKLSKIFNIAGFEEFRLVHSQILNSSKTKGTLCLSIHPLDFMTMSDNANGWKSCMSWKNNGCYRQGTVEMMNSSSVIVAYLESSVTRMSIGKNTWNSKRWRELFIVSNEMICGVKAYPFKNDALEDIILDEIKNLVDPDSKHYYNKPALFTFYGKDDIVINGVTLKTDITIYPTTALMYNDIEANCDDPYAVYLNKELESNTKYEVQYSKGYDSECMVCGDYGNELFSETGSLCCIDCEDY